MILECTICFTQFEGVYCPKCNPELVVQEDGTDVTKQSHYTKWKIQPATYIIENGMSYAQGCAIKYLTRFKDKGTPVQDLKKAKHYIDMLIQMEENGRIEL